MYLNETYSDTPKIPMYLLNIFIRIVKLTTLLYTQCSELSQIRILNKGENIL